MNRLLLIFLLIPFFSKAQTDTATVEFPYKDGKIVYEQIVDVKGISQKQLYAYSKKWLVDNFKSAKAVIQSEDEASGQIIGNGILDIRDSKTGGLFTSQYALDIKIQINCKDDKYRIRFYELRGFIPNNTALVGTYIPLEQTESAYKAIKKQNASKKRWDRLKVVTQFQLTSLLKSFNDNIETSKSDEF